MMSRTGRQPLLFWSTLLLGLVLLVQGLTISPGTRRTWRLLIPEIARGNIGVGPWPDQPNSFDFSQAEPGDIIIGGKEGSPWGYYTHATLYLGDGLVADAQLRSGVNPGPLAHFHDYARAGILRVKAPPELKARAVAAVRDREGRPFYLLAPRGSADWFYCTKLVWWAYEQAGLDLDTGSGFWLLPDQLFLSPHVQPIAGTLPPPAGAAS